MQRLYTVAAWMEKFSDDGHIERIILIGLFFLYEVSHISLASVFGSLIMTPISRPLLINLIDNHVADRLIIKKCQEKCRSLKKNSRGKLPPSPS